MEDAPHDTAPHDTAPDPRAVSAVKRLAPLMLLLALVVVYDRTKHDLRGNLVTAGNAYADWVANIVNAPESEAARTELISRMVGVYRSTPVGKSLSLRDDQGRVIGRFRISQAAVHQQPGAEGDWHARRRFEVRLSGDGELWHATGGRVRFKGGADVSYVIDFRVRDWKVFSYFDCVAIRDTAFEVTHVDNVLGRIFSGFVNDAGRKALQEGIKPGFTIVTHMDGKSYVAHGRAGPDFVPRAGPWPEDEGWTTLCNDTGVLRRDFRDYLGPFQVEPGVELRIDLRVSGEAGRPAPGVDLLLLRPEAFEQYEERYFSGAPGKMADLEVTALDARWGTRELSYAAKPMPGVYYLLIDRTPFGKSDQGAQINDVLAEVSYYARIKR